MGADGSHLVDIILLADDRINVIGRPWWTVLIDVKTRVILGYYLSLHVPSATSVACALTHSVLPKSTFVTKVGLTLEDYPYYGKPEVLHMDNAAEFTSPKFKAGCAAFDIHPEYRPIGKKHYGGHVESLIGTFMTTKVHLLKGTTMSNTVARGKLDSDRAATMTFSDFARWFAQEVTVYHSTIHSELGTSPRQAWTEYFAPNGGVPYPPRISDPEQLRLYFMPEETRMINPYGICLHGNIYWDPVLTAHVGTANAIIKFDPFNLNEIWVKLNGRFSSIRLSDLTLQVQSLEEYRASKFFRLPVRVGAIDDDVGRSAYREKQKIEKQSASLTRKARRQQAAEKEYHQAYPRPIIDNLSPRQPQINQTIQLLLNASHVRTEMNSDHVRPDVQKFIHADISTRISAVQQELWIDNNSSEAVFRIMNNIHAVPDRLSAPALLVVGPGGSGKTAIISRIPQRVNGSEDSCSFPWPSPRNYM